MSDENCKSRDLVCGGNALLLWGLPVIALIVGANWRPGLLFLWIPAFLVMGGACLVNAARCGRVHCYITGPLCLLAAVYVALWGFHLVPMQPNTFLNSVAALTILAFLAEFPLGRYRSASSHK